MREGYSDFGRQGEHIEGVEGVRYVRYCDDLVVGLPYREVPECYLGRFCDEGPLSLEAFLLLGHVEPVHLPSLLSLFFLQNGQLSHIQLSLFLFLSLHSKL